MPLYTHEYPNEHGETGKGLDSHNLLLITLIFCLVVNTIPQYSIPTFCSSLCLHKSHDGVSQGGLTEMGHALFLFWIVRLKGFNVTGNTSSRKLGPSFLARPQARPPPDKQLLLYRVDKARLCMTFQPFS